MSFPISASSDSVGSLIIQSPLLERKLLFRANSRRAVSRSLSEGPSRRRSEPCKRRPLSGLSHPFNETANPATMSVTLSTTFASAWFSQPASSLKRRASGLSGTMPSPTSFATSAIGT